MEMEAKVSSGVTVVGSDAPSSYQLAPRSDVITGKLTGGPAPVNQVVGPMISLHGSSEVKKKRGRPRKYAPGGGPIDFSDKPISAATVIDFTAQKRPKLKPITNTTTTVIKQHADQPKFEALNSACAGETVPCAVAANFTPHIITVNAGEDVTIKVISFSQQGPRAICILSANGVISSVTLRQPDSSGGTLTYEGRFEILSLTGSFMPSESGGIRNRSGGLSVSLASPDGRIIGGGVAGLLVAASPIQIVVGSFLAGNQHEQKPNKQISEFFTNASPGAIVPVSSISMHDAYGAQGRPTTGTTHLSFQNDTRNGSTESLHED